MKERTKFCDHTPDQSDFKQCSLVESKSECKLNQRPLEFIDDDYYFYFLHLLLQANNLFKKTYSERNYVQTNLLIEHIVFLNKKKVYLSLLFKLYE